MYTVAKDVKIQVEFNPARVSAYRLIGYENRLLRDEDFVDDSKDAGDVGSGHSVTAMYEIVPVGVETDVDIVTPDSLRYQVTKLDPEAGESAEMLFVQVRYKEPDGETSRLFTHSVANELVDAPSPDLQFQLAVAEFGLLLRDSKYRGNANAGQVAELARAGLGTDPHGYRSEFLRLVEVAAAIGLEGETR